MENYLFLALGLALLIGGAELLVKGASELALSMKISPLVVGLTVVAMGTSMPELIVSVKSALWGNADIAFGNVVGSNICNMAFILASVALIFPIKVRKKILSFDWVILFATTVVLYVFILDRTIAIWEAIILVIGIITYNYFLISSSRKETKSKIEDGSMVAKVFDFKLFSRDMGFIAIGIFAMLYGSDWLIESAENIAEKFGISDRVIGISIVAVGTSLPELATSVMAAVRKKNDIGLGNIIGSNIFNILGILGVTGLIKEIHVDQMFIYSDMVWTLAITIALLPIMWTRMVISKTEGAILLAAYFTYIILAFLK